MPPLLLLLAQAADVPPDAATMVATARATITGPRCPTTTDTTDVTVCGRRQADRYRVPLQVERPRGAGMADSASAERSALTHRATQLERLSPFLVETGHVGVTASTAFGPGAATGRPRIRGARPLAP